MGDSPEHLLDTRRILQVMQPTVLIGLIAIGFDTGRLAARGILLSMACLAAGVLTGFLFGIPKVLQGEHKSTGSDLSSYRQRVNTNLEEISDWLTKIIVGLGLFELKQVPSLIGHLGAAFAESFPDPARQHAVFCCAIVFFTTSGFLMGYLVTRLYLQGALGRADFAATPDMLGVQKQKASKTKASDEPESDEPVESTTALRRDQV